MALDKKDILRSFTDPRGRFKILALDHVNGLRKTLAAIGGVPTVPNEHIFKLKRMIAKTLIADLSAILLDKGAFTELEDLIPPNMGVLLKLDDGWKEAEAGSRITKVFAEKCVQIAASQGVQGVKLMLYYRHDAPRKVREAQENLVRKIGEECRKLGMAFCLEPWWYPLHKEEQGDTASSERVLAERRPDLVIQPLEEFSNPEYNIDLFKLEFPVDLRYVRDFPVDTARETAKEPLYDLDTARHACARIDTLLKVPWTVMSSGVSIDQFQRYLMVGMSGKLAGYICGQALWRDAIQPYPDFQRIEESLTEISLPRLKKLNQILNMFV